MDAISLLQIDGLGHREDDECRYRSEETENQSPASTLLRRRTRIAPLNIAISPAKIRKQDRHPGDLRLRDCARMVLKVCPKTPAKNRLADDLHDNSLDNQESDAGGEFPAPCTAGDPAASLEFDG